ncbi:MULTISPECIES: hypothetical protein [unclassified Pseudofrankia]|uniref:hypothetical protein n=1 Tax=unclassified Pseudofrankia TaxID=2994372 RepID=UPI0009F4CA19|nr:MULTISPECIES: hypothetical protein [unclassified Pseudofrankia]MDT3438116.1 hypothetical protein [Pseudofrankia sp. BMG5.37]
MSGRSPQTQATTGSTITDRRGALALALVTGLTETGTGAGGHPEVRVSLHVTGSGFAFDTAARLLAGESRRASLDAGKIVVLVDPSTHAIQIDWARSALVNGLVPALFTLAEDDTTYDLSGQIGPLMEILQVLWAGGVSLNRTVDAHCDPALRGQLQAIIRRAPAQPPRTDRPEPELDA